MQTFLPYPSFKDSLACLDNKRLGKQRVEAYQILRCLTTHPSRWINHPAVKMWKGYEDALAIYMNLAIDEWIYRGFNNTMVKAAIFLSPIAICPEWFGDKNFHLAHRYNLLRKDFDFYKTYFKEEARSPKEFIDVYPYLWPNQSHNKAPQNIRLNDIVK